MTPCLLLLVMPEKVVKSRMRNNKQTSKNKENDVVSFHAEYSLLPAVNYFLPTVLVCTVFL